MPADVSPEPSRAGSVVLIIGENVGAAVVLAPASLAGTEMEIRPDGVPWDGRHVEVRARQLPGGTIYAALFDNLAPGWHEVRVRGRASAAPGSGSGPAGRFLVTGGRVTEARL